jgi:hypothetical protein
LLPYQKNSFLTKEGNFVTFLKAKLWASDIGMKTEKKLRAVKLYHGPIFENLVKK